MPVCPTCETANPEGYRFCGRCGNALSATACPACGAANPDGQAFCGACGSRLGVPEAVPGTPAVEERKLATVLFADVVGFTSLAERTDHEVVARMVDAAFRTLGEIVAEHGGHVDKYMGDSVMAVFGVPVAHDDDAERAVAAGLAMRELAGELAFSIGVNSGEVMATAVAGGPDVTVIGDTVNVAARLEKVAGTGEVLCGSLTAELTAHRVEYREREPVLLKGKGQPVAVFEAIALRQAESGPAPDAPALVGRDDELAFLVAQWRRVCRDRKAHVVLLCGDAGSGKTRLAAELGLVAASDGEVVRAAYPAYGPMGGTRVAAELIRQLGPLGDDVVDARVRSVTGELDPSLRGIDPAAVRREQVWAFDRLLQQKAAERPLLLVIDDMHRGGDHTLEMLSELAARLTSGALLTLLVGRTDPGDWVNRFPAATTIRLSALGPGDAATLAGAFAPDRPMAAETLEFFATRAGGNPLYIRELVKVARDSGALVDDGGRYRLTSHTAVPATLKALLAARLDSLSPSQKLVLQHAAVIGDPVSPVQVADLGPPGADAGADLRALVDERLVVQGRDGRFEVADSLLSEVAYETLPRHLRGALHRRVAAAVGAPEQRARHLDHAAGYLPEDQGLSGEAGAALAAAGEAFAEAGRHLDALPLLERAVARGYRRPEGLLELARIQALCGLEDQALDTLALVVDDPAAPELGAERDHVAANSRTFVEPAWAAPRLDVAAERWQALGNTRKEAWARANAGVANFYLGRIEDAALRLEEALRLFEALGDEGGAVAASSFLCLVSPADPRVPEWLAGALELADTAGDRSKQISVLATLSWHHFLRSFCGNPRDTAEAEGFARRLAELGEELGANDTAVQGWSLLAIMARFSGRIDEATAHVAALQRVAGSLQHGDPWLGLAAGFAVAVARGVAGAVPPYPPADSPDPVVAMARLVVEAELTMAGRIEEARTRLEGGRSSGLGPIGDMAGLLHGIALVLMGRPGEARDWIERAYVAARSLDARPIADGAAALLAEIDGDLSRLAPAPEQAEGLGELLLLRAHASGGDEAAAEELRRAGKALGMTGLAAGV